MKETLPNLFKREPRSHETPEQSIERLSGVFLRNALIKELRKQDDGKGLNAWWNDTDATEHVREQALRQAHDWLMRDFRQRESLVGKLLSTLVRPPGQQGYPESLIENTWLAFKNDFLDTQKPK